MTYTCRIDVIGQVRDGTRGSFSRHFKSMPDILGVRYFERVEDYRITQITTSSTQDGLVTHFHRAEQTLRDWQREDCARLFAGQNL